MQIVEHEGHQIVADSVRIENVDGESVYLPIVQIFKAGVRVQIIVGNELVYSTVQ